jgi:hypothetical protein
LNEPNGVHPTEVGYENLETLVTKFMRNSDGAHENSSVAKVNGSVTRTFRTGAFRRAVARSRSSQVQNVQVDPHMKLIALGEHANSTTLCQTRGSVALIFSKRRRVAPGLRVTGSVKRARVWVKDDDAGGR